MRIDVRSDTELRGQSLKSIGREMLDTSAVGNLTKETANMRTSKFVTKFGGTLSCASIKNRFLIVNSGANRNNALEC